jgi:hypothetical protein
MLQLPSQSLADLYVEVVAPKEEPQHAAAHEEVLHPNAHDDIHGAQFYDCSRTCWCQCHVQRMPASSSSNAALLASTKLLHELLHC